MSHLGGGAGGVKLGGQAGGQKAAWLGPKGWLGVVWWNVVGWSGLGPDRCEAAAFQSPSTPVDNKVGASGAVMAGLGERKHNQLA